MPSSSLVVSERLRSLLLLPLLAIALLAGESSGYSTSSIASRLVALQPALDTSKITRIADFAAAAYFPDNKFQSWSNDRKLVMPTTFTDAASETRGYLGVDEEGGRVVLSFRGSGTLKNFLTNLNFQLIPFDHPCVSVPDIRVHRGFSTVSLRLYESQLKDKILHLTEKYPDFDLTVTGHSLGGGVAILTSYLLAHDSKLSPSLITFGAPLVGNQQFADAHALCVPEILHVVHDADPILYNNEPLWRDNGFVRSGQVLNCSPQSFEAPQPSEGFRVPPWNLVDHLWYMGRYMGPQL
ncbi:hypothetical protein GUITHDRAFT_154009 [Guillardia theta CCMP2712]|uniref:Fungal lipase-type domain-containing protein n=1 Tax=Guillardia theta (strain CCMP2712) TaxID=905079 RepID=L1IYC5_GUITC|nr:hypothetical protein GUITHDRAFT_154009 [Guillardia theta CCMP2712]EKX40810.1 hypothetical protein GUITHDRAFT_154009 [Guillardia theta CCMP2712]|eukprot:XP_005827790.1 hypothetical protein GUITHDRAFT_154009 [Guillardia theta CCMP2712]